jgi:glycerophosphoryl diester phosphodiesterase
MSHPLIIAHRGDRKNFPENTLPAFESAIAKGANAIEFDVHQTKDGELVVHHDDYLGRVEQATGYIETYTLEQLQSLDVGSWFDRRFSGLKMPTLNDVLALGNATIRFEIELCTATLPFLRTVIDAIAKKGLEERIELTSWHLPLLLHVKEINPRLRTGIFFEPFPDWMQPAERHGRILNWLVLSNAQVAPLPPSLINDDLVSRLHEKGLKVHGADLNSKEEMHMAIKMQVDQFSTDNLDLALSCKTHHP